MTMRGNKSVGPVAKLLFGLIIMLSVGILFLAFRGFQKEPNGPVIGSQALPGQAAQRAGASPNRRPVGAP
jgi:hypothetical protein